MLLPINWIKKYVDIDIDSRALADALTLSGSHVESITNLGEALDNIVVGRVIEIEKHPEADKLVVTKIDVGRETLQIVTGAPNIEKDAYVIVALEGAVMADGLEIKTSKLRGIESRGMCCSYQELGFSESVTPKEYREGIVLLKGDFEPGTPIGQALGLDDEVIELEITPNRPDCLSMLGMARETAATIGKKLTYPEKDLAESANEVDFSGAIETEKCPKLVTAAITDVEIKESPVWLQTYLMKAGMRPINNIVDISNYVMMEYGQPLHAYDLDTLKGRKIIVGEAKDGDSLISLDGETRKLSQGDIIISDEERIIGLAGVMGGFDTEVTEKTKNVLIESASFNKAQIRKTSSRIGLRSEASSRFEKGVSPAIALDAAQRVLYLAEQIGAGKASSNFEVLEKESKEPAQVEFRYQRVNDLLGTKIEKDQMISYLERLEFEVEDKGDKGLAKPPAFRADIEIEEDIIEEIGRIFGFHNIEPQALVSKLSKGRMSREKDKEYKMKNDLFALGYAEVLTYSFVSPRLNERAGINKAELNDFIRLENPLGEEFSVMRTSILPNHLEILSRNINNKCEDLATFELGNIFIKGDFDQIEKRRLVMTSYGQVDFYSFKADFLALMKASGIEDMKFVARNDLDFFHGGRCAEILLGDKSLGYMGEISYATREEFSISTRAYALEIDLDLINEVSTREKTYEKISKFPAIVRDLSLVVAKETSHEDIKSLILEKPYEILAGVRLIDIYTGEQIDEDKKSMTYEIIYRSKERTLVDDEVNAIQDEIISRLEDKSIYLRK